MNLPLLIQGLRDTQSAVRLNVVRVVGLVEETRLLEPLREQFKVEPDATVRSAIEWAGKRLYTASQNGYSTIDAIFVYFNIDKEIANAPDEKEVDLMRQMQSQLDRDLMKMQTESANKRVGLAAGAALGGMLVGGVIGGSAMASAAASTALGPTIDASSNMGQTRESLSVTRTPPPIPSNADVKIWLKRLREDANPENRKKAAIELGNMSNTAALPHLATSFTSDSSPEVRQIAERSGKLIYWGAIYWQMSQDGSLEQEIAQRKQSGIRATQNIRATQSMQVVQPKEEDIASILRRTEEKRKLKKK